MTKQVGRDSRVRPLQEGFESSEIGTHSELAVDAGVRPVGIMAAMRVVLLGLVMGFSSGAVLAGHSKSSNVKPGVSRCSDTNTVNLGEPASAAPDPRQPLDCRVVAETSNAWIVDERFTFGSASAANAFSRVAGRGIADGGGVETLDNARAEQWLAQTQDAPPTNAPPPVMPEPITPAPPSPPTLVPPPTGPTPPNPPPEVPPPGIPQPPGAPPEIPPQLPTPPGAPPETPPQAVTPPPTAIPPNVVPQPVKPPPPATIGANTFRASRVRSHV